MYFHCVNICFVLEKINYNLELHLELVLFNVYAANYRYMNTGVEYVYLSNNMYFRERLKYFKVD
jgi:hypothetical protein